MIRFHVLSLYPDLFDSFLSQSLIGRAIKDKKLDVNLVNFRKHGLGKHHRVDDMPYGGGAGMVIQMEPLVRTLTEIEAEQKTHKILITPQGKPFTQKRAVELSLLDKPISLICGRFEGFDARIEHYVDESISMGDFVLLGGEIPAMGVIEAVSRLIPGIIGNGESLSDESFESGLLEYDQYTRPPEFEGYQVPKILLSGNHKLIQEWRDQNALAKTKRLRPDLIQPVSE